MDNTIYKEIINREIEMMFGLQKKPDTGQKRGAARSSKDSEGDKDSLDNSILHIDESDEYSDSMPDEPSPGAGARSPGKKQLGDFEANMKKVLSNYS